MPDDQPFDDPFAPDAPEPDAWAAFEAALGDMPPDPYPEGWTIEKGNEKDPDDSPDAQGRRAAKLALRVRRARDTQTMQRTMMGVEIDLLEEALAAKIEALRAEHQPGIDAAKHRREQTDRWFLARTEFERRHLRFWRETAEMFKDAAVKVIQLAFGLTIGSRSVPERAKWEAEVEDLQGILPDECFDREPRLRKAEANKLVHVADGKAIVTATGQVIEGAAVTVTPGFEEFFLTEGAGHEKIALSGWATEDADTGGGDDAAE